MVDNDLQGAGRSAPQSGTGQGLRAASQAMGGPGQSPHKVPDVPATDCVQLVFAPAQVAGHFPVLCMLLCRVQCAGTLPGVATVSIHEIFITL